MSRKGCKICEHASRDDIEKLILNGELYRRIVYKYPDLNIMNISRHKSHMFDETPERLQELINQALRNKNLSVDNVSDLVKLLDHQKRFEEQYKNIPDPDAPTLEGALSEYLALNQDSSPIDDYIRLNPSQHIEFAYWLRKQTTDLQIYMCPSTYHKFKGEQNLKHLAEQL